VADFGVTPTGFVAKPLETILAEMGADLRATIASGINLETVSPTGQILGTVAGQISKVWEVTEDVYHAGQTSADGYSLDAVCALTGTTRSPGVPSTVTLTLNLEPGASIPADSRVQVAGDATAVFRTRALVENLGATAANFSVEASAETYGPTVANTGTITVILDSVVGWNTVTNPGDAILGSLVQDDPSLRASREEELARGGSTTIDAIRTDLLDVKDVTTAQVVENDTDATVDSIPAHSIEAIVVGGNDADVAKALWDSKPPGTGTYGTTTTVVLDDTGVAHSVSFTRPANVDIWVDVTITGADPLSYVGDDAVKAALIAYQASLPVGSDVIRKRLEAVVFGLGGIKGVPEADVAVLIGLVDPPVLTTNIAINSRQRAVLDTARIDVS
jgi:uncharacterized phage protein gp47/JayE